ncbi:MAG TPA: S8 family serine peptidase [Streptosporangiaceae bacterium]|nr:S8 family serine peptidase [Streptosporangiaceae bacterium]
MRYRHALLKAPIAVAALLLAIPATAQAGGMAGRIGARGLPALTPALAKALSRHVTDKVIVVFRDQLRRLPDTPADSARRAAAAHASQAGVLADLKATHAVGVKSISLVNAVAATVSAGEANRLAADPAVAAVTPDRPIPLAPSAPLIKPAKVAAGLKPLPNACPAKKTVQLNPEAVVAIHAATQSGKGNSAQALGYTGSGVKVAFIADRADPNNPDFIRANGKHVFVDDKDFSGTGTFAPTDSSEAFLDASSVAAQGRHTYDVSDYGAKLSVPCRIRILGVAPGASLVGLNVIGSSFAVFSSVFLEAIDYAVTKDHVNVINESFGFHKYPDVDSTDLIELANDAAVKASVVVTIASGDSGVTNTIASPASDPHTISVGATTTYRAYAQAGFADITARGVKGWIDNNISGLSSGGFDQSGHTVDVVAPGDLNWALCSPKHLFPGCVDFHGHASRVELEGGTSEAAPLTAGVAALVIQAYEQGHHGQRPTPAIVKKIIVSTAQDIGAPAEQQGAGMIDAYQAVLAARSYQGGAGGSGGSSPRASTVKPKAGHAVVASATQFNAVGGRSTSERFTETLTNAGRGPVTVHLSGRTLSRYATIASKTLHLAKVSKYTTRVRFDVAPGTARLNASLALVGFADLSLIAPNGDLAEFNLAQGLSHLEDAQVANPAKGTWTALITASPAGGGKVVPAEFLAQTATWRSFGTLSARSLSLPEGASRRFSLTVSTPSAPGDQSGAIVLRTSAGTPSFARQTTIPVTLRSLAPSSGTFSGTLTGGNGRDENSGQTAYYEIDIRPGTPALNATISLPSRSDPLLLAELVSPTGLVESAANSVLPGLAPSGPRTGAELHLMRPVAGNWTLIVDFVNPVSGTRTVTPFTVTLDDHAVKATQTGLPTSAHALLVAGKPVTAHLTITNASALPQQYFVDARRVGQAWLPLSPQTPATLKLPNLGGHVPAFLVPSGTVGIAAKVAAPAPNFFGLSWALGDPDVISSTGKTSTAEFSAPEVPNGFWAVTPYRVGPDGSKLTKPVRAHVTMRALTAPFDPTITSPTGDLWLQITSKAALHPRFAKPGQKITIDVRIDPKGAPGKAVSGTIYISTISFNSSNLAYDFLLGEFEAFLPTGSNVAAFHYAYTIAP